MIEYADSTIADLQQATNFIHHIKPSLRDKLVFAIEIPQPLDQSVVFHLMKRKVEEGEARSKEDNEIFLLSAEYILEHPFWKGSKT